MVRWRSREPEAGLGFAARGVGDAKTGHFAVRLGENAIFHAKIAKDRPVDRIDEIAAELFAGKSFFVEQRDFVAEPRQTDGRGRTCGTGADDDDVEISHDQSS